MLPNSLSALGKMSLAYSLLDSISGSDTILGDPDTYLDYIICKANLLKILEQNGLDVSLLKKINK